MVDKKFIIKESGVYRLKFIDYEFIESEGKLYYITPFRHFRKRLLSKPLVITQIRRYGDRYFFFGTINNISFSYRNMYELTQFIHERGYVYQGKLGRNLLREYLNLLIKIRRRI
ncbi:MAG: hypothetical protein ACFFG0_04900 [Candidatus Thorarchaeota archaeon]